MRIGVDVRHLASGPFTGVGVVTKELIPALAESLPDAELRVFYNGWHAPPKLLNEWSKAYQNISVKVQRVPNRIFDVAVQTVGIPSASHFFEDVDVHLSPHMLPVPYSRTPRVLIVHDISFVRHPEYFHPRRSFWHRRIAPQTQARRAAAIIVPSNATARDIERLWGIPKSRIHVVPWGVPKADNNNTEFLEKAGRMILCLGTIGRRKNQCVLVEAFAILRENAEFQDVQLCLVGDLEWGSDEVILKIKEQNASVRDAIKIMGYVTEEEKNRVFAEASVFVYPSLYEGAALPILEAMHAHVPIIASRLTAIPETVGSAGILIDPSRPAEIAQAIERVLSGSTLRDNLVCRGNKRAEQFTWSKAGEKVSLILREVADAKKLKCDNV